MAVSSNLWCTVLLLGFASRTTAGPVIDAIPVEVIVDEAGRWSLVTAPSEPTDLDGLRDVLPDKIPVWSVGPGGERGAGVTYLNRSDRPQANACARYPDLVVLMPDGTWHVDAQLWSTIHKIVPPGGSHLIPGSEDARLMVADPDEPGRVVPLHPSPARVAVGPVDLAWTPGGHTEYFDVLVYDVGPARGTPVEVFRATDLTGTSVTIPDGTLEPGRRYDWYVVSFNWRGYVRSAVSTFFTEGGCPADFNGDGQLTVADYTAFDKAFQAGDPRADFNGDGSLTVADFTAFRTAFLAGCP